MAERLANGRFIPGCKPGPGNPFADKVAKYRSALTRAVTPAQFLRIARKMAELAEAGDTDAAKIVLDRLLGRPVQPMEVSGSLAMTHSAIIGQAFNGGFPRESRIDAALQAAGVSGGPN